MAPPRNVSRQLALRYADKPMAPTRVARARVMVAEYMVPGVCGGVCVRGGVLTLSCLRHKSGSDYDLVAANANFVNLFNGTETGSPALPPLVDALTANGLPVAGVYLYDQLSPSAYVDRGTAPIAQDEVGTWQLGQNFRVVVDIPFNLWQTNDQTYKGAFAAALSSTLGWEPPVGVLVKNFRKSLSNTTVDVVISAASAEALAGLVDSMRGLFTQCSAPSGDGCPAGEGSALVTNLKSFGLPVTDAFFAL